MTPFEEQILRQQQKISSEISGLREECARRFAELEQHDRECYGNGQPGWKATHERQISTLVADRNKSRGMKGAVGWLWGTALSLGTLFFEYMIHRH